MRRSFIVLITAICLVAALGLFAGACGGGDDSIVGVWTDGSDMDFEFTSDGAMIISFMGQKAEVKYSIDGDKLTISDDQAGAFPPVMGFEVDGDKLTLTNEDGDKQTLKRK